MKPLECLFAFVCEASGVCVCISEGLAKCVNICSLGEYVFHICLYSRSPVGGRTLCFHHQQCLSQRGVDSRIQSREVVISRNEMAVLRTEGLCPPQNYTLKP